MNLPIKKFKSGNMEVSIWENKKVIETDEINYKTVSLRKFWKQGDQWHDQTISNLKGNDLMKISLLLQKAMEELFLKEDEKNE